MNASVDKIVVLQPMFLPWAGYFDQIRLCDVFVHFDDVLLPQGRYFTNRVQLKTLQGQQWLTVPIIRSSRGLIKDVRIDETSGWRNTHLKTFVQHLAKHQFFEDVIELLEKIYSFESDKLSDFNVNAVEMIASFLGLERVFIKSSELNIGGSSSQKLLNVVKRLNGKTYITGHGAKNYLDHELFEKANIKVEYIDYDILPYPQLYGEFTPYVTIIDLIACMGKESVSFLNSKTISWKEFVHGRP